MRRTLARRFAQNPTPWSSPEFWESFYSRKPSAQSFDWFTGNNFLLEAICDNVLSSSGSSGESEKKLRVLHVGAGTSGLASHLHHSLPANSTLIHTDLSPLAVSNLKSQLDGFLSENHKVVRSDVTTATLDNLGAAEPFDVVVDKGLIDVFVHGSDNVLFAKALSSIHSLLSPSGRYIMVTNDDPEFRDALIREHGGGLWDVMGMKRKHLVDEQVEITMLTITKAKRVQR
jgi:hypothetical protein